MAAGWTSDADLGPRDRLLGLDAGLASGTDPAGLGSSAILRAGLPATTV